MSTLTSTISPAKRTGDGRASREKRLSPTLISILARKEIRDALRNRWFILYAVCFAALSLALSSVALAGTGRFGMAGFGRTAASLVNLVLLIVPLMGLTLGAAALAGERERGTLETLLSQPITRGEVLLGKFVGLAAALLGALAAGFGTTGAVLAIQGASANAVQFISIFALSVLLGWSMLSVGFLISALARRTTLALGTAIFVWLGFVFLGDLGLMGGALTLRLSAEELLAWALLNPLQVFKMFAVSGMHRSLDLLGPAGLYASQTFGSALPALFGGVLCAWVVLPLATAWAVFSMRGVR
jgi:Cu-processing system permease protein